MNRLNVIWIEPNIDSEENQAYLKQLKSYNSLNIKYFTNTEDGIDYIKTIKFESAKIIISGRLYFQFILKLKENIKELLVIPKIIVFTGDANDFIENNKKFEKIINHPFYNHGGINDSFDEIKYFLENKKKNISKYKEIKNDATQSTIQIFKKLGLLEKIDIQLTFEYIDCIEKLELPLLYQALIDLTKINKIENYNELLYSKYGHNTLFPGI